MDKRAAGILMPITSLPSEYGIGCFSKSAYDFVDWLKEAGQSVCTKEETDERCRRYVDVIRKGK